MPLYLLWAAFLLAAHPASPSIAGGCFRLQSCSALTSTARAPCQCLWQARPRLSPASTQPTPDTGRRVLSCCFSTDRSLSLLQSLAVGSLHHWPPRWGTVVWGGGHGAFPESSTPSQHTAGLPARVGLAGREQTRCPGPWLSTVVGHGASWQGPCPEPPRSCAS